MGSPTIILITGANRGTGQGFSKTFLARPSTTLIAAVRDPEHSTSKALGDLPKGPGSQLITVQLDSTKPDTTAAVIKKLQTDHGIGSLDLVIASAGIALDGSSVGETSLENINKHHLVNAVAPIALFQATADLLRASETENATFVAISTLIGSIGAMEGLAGFPNTHSPYGGSKAELNWFVRRLHFEEPWLTSFVFHPGLVETDLAAGAAKATGVKLSNLGAISVETSVAAMVKTIDKASREIGGTFQNYDGTILPW